jgi:hypothetical protein
MTWRKFLLASALIIQLVALRKWGDIAIAPLWFLGCLWLFWVGDGRQVRFAFRWMKLRRLGRQLEARWNSGECGNCGYNATGNTSGVCPECGEAVKRDPSAFDSDSPPKK